jgi:SAM-dependent methyltransferase
MVAAQADLRGLSERARRFYEEDDEQRWGRTDIPNLAEIVERLLRTSSQGNRSVVLELGCGRGAFRHLAAACHYVALDLSRNVLRRYLRSLAAVQADMERIPLASGSVDLVFSVCALEHVPQPSRVLTEIHRVLRPGGVALLAPAWFCRDWAAKGLPVRSYSELSTADKLRKALIPVRNSLIWRSAFVLPRRLARELRFLMRPGKWRMRYRQLQPNFREYVYTDCDAACSLDPHEVVLLFRRWGYSAFGAGTLRERLVLRHAPLTLQKPAATP